MTEHLDFLLSALVLGNMLQSKRAGDALTENLAESSEKNRRICTGGAETLDLLISGLSALHCFSCFITAILEH